MCKLLQIPDKNSNEINMEVGRAQYWHFLCPCFYVKSQTSSSLAGRIFYLLFADKTYQIYWNVFQKPSSIDPKRSVLWTIAFWHENVKFSDSILIHKSSTTYCKSKTTDETKNYDDFTKKLWYQSLMKNIRWNSS